MSGAGTSRSISAKKKLCSGVGQAQVRDPRSVESAPALSVAAYALLLLATQRAFADSRQALLPRPKWIHPSPSARISTQQAIHQLRAEVWGRGLGLDNFSRLRVHPTPCHEAGEILFPSRIGRLLR